MNANIMSLAGDLVLPLSALDLRQAANAFLCVAGPFFFFGMQVSSLQTAIKIAKNSSIGPFSPVPFLSLFTNGSVWFIYGSVKSDWTILVPNFTAVVVGCICVSIFHKTAKEGIPVYLYLCSCLIVIPSVFLGAFGDIITLGLIGVFLSILLTGSPLSTVSTVLKERSTESMPFATSLAAFLNCLSWTLYGYYVAEDFILWVSSAIGLLFAIFQLVLFVIFGISSRSRGDVSQVEIINVQVRLWLLFRNDVVIKVFLRLIQTILLIYRW
jgi:solute carrier family 50 (sugar transporter)